MKKKKSDLLRFFKKTKKNKFYKLMKKKTRPAKKNNFRIEDFKNKEEKSDLLRKSQNKRRSKETREIFYSWSKILLGLKTPTKR